MISQKRLCVTESNDELMKPEQSHIMIPKAHFRMTLKKCWQFKTKLLLIPAKETPNMGSKQFDCPTLPNHITALQMTSSETFQKVPWGDDVFASAFARPRKIRARLFLFNKPIKCFTFLFTFCFHVYFSTSYESRSITRIITSLVIHTPISCDCVTHNENLIEMLISVNTAVPVRSTLTNINELTNLHGKTGSKKKKYEGR